MFAFSVGVIVAAFVIFLLLSRLIAREKGLMEFYENAATTHIWLNDDAGRCAAVAAAKSATRAQRDRMAAYLTRLSSDLPEGEPAFEAPRARSCTLVESIEAADWNAQDAAVARQELAAIAPDYAKALRRRDPSPFACRYPGLFDAKDFVSLAKAAEREVSNP